MTTLDYATMEPLDKQRYLEAILTNPAYLYAVSTLKASYAVSAIHDPSPSTREENRLKILVMEAVISFFETEYQLAKGALQAPRQA